MPESCLFCRIVRSEIPADVVVETEQALAIRDINPEAPVHVLVFPKSHVASLIDLKDEAELGHLMGLATRVAVEQGVGESGFRTVVNTRADGGQTFNHLHIHVLGGRRMAWPPG